MTKDEVKEQIIKIFPKLNSDSKFKITSKRDLKYNCIAWAAIFDDKFMWPPGGIMNLDGVTSFWPEDLPTDESVQTFVKLYEKYSFEVCENPDFEEGFRKIAIYWDPEKKTCTHAARQRSNGDWTSKLGPAQDISHSNPFTLESEVYGVVAKFMKKKY
jgi:hypothetical protein